MTVSGQFLLAVDTGSANRRFGAGGRRGKSAASERGHPAALPFVTWRVTFFVEQATRTSDGWSVQGEDGLGPPAPGDRFTFVHHRDTGEEAVDLTVVEVNAGSLRLTGASSMSLETGDLLGGVRDQ